MKITREQFKNIVRETLLEESEYQKFFKKALEKAGKSIPKMSDEEKKAFFNKIEKTWKGRGSKNERFGRGAVGPTFGSQELDEVNPNSSEIGKGDNKKPSKDASDSSNIKEAKFKAKGYKPKDAFGARIIKAIDNNIVASDVQDLKREGDDNAKILEKGKAFLDMAQNGIKSAFKFKYQIHPDVDFPMRQTRGSNYFWFKSREDMEKYLKSELANWQKSASGAMSDDFTQERQVDFAERLLKGMEGFLNKKSIYDGTYLFSGENMDTKPVSLSGNVDADKYYLGSKYDMSFTYGDNQIKLDFNAGDSSIKNLVELFISVKNDSAGDKDDVFVKFEKCIEKIIDAKERVDFISRDLKQFSDMQKVNLQQSADSYDNITKIGEYTASMELSQISKRLSEIYSSMGVLNKSLVDYL